MTAHNQHKQLWTDPDGVFRCILYVDGIVIEVEPHASDFGKPAGFYDENSRPMLNLFVDEGYNTRVNRPV